MSDARGVPCFAELDVDDPDAAAAFYAAVLGWTVDDAVRADHQHRLLRHDGVAVAARWVEDGAPGRLVGHGPDGPLAGLALAGDALPLAPVFGVADVDVTLRAAQAAGGTVLAGVEDGRATLADPAGAAFGVLRLD